MYSQGQRGVKGYASFLDRYADPPHSPTTGMGPIRTYPDDLGARARAMRAYRDLSQKQLADRIGVGRNAIRALEDEGSVGRHGVHTTLVLKAVADECRLPFEFFLFAWSDLPRLATQGATAALIAAAGREAPGSDKPQAPDQTDGRRGDRGQ